MPNRFREKELSELVGASLVPGDDPRFDGAHDEGGVYVTDNGASQQVEDHDHFDPVDVDQDPYLPGVVDNDGVPGMRPFVDASNSFEEEAGLEQAPTDEEEAESESLGDEFHDRLAQDDEASVDVEGRPRSDLDRMAHSAGLKQQAIQTVAPFVRINPETASRALLGGRATVNPGQDPVQVINWVGEDVEACAVTITLQPLIVFGTSGASSPATIQGFARISWGSRDGVQTVDVDVGSGCQLTVVASVVYVSVGQQPLTGLLLGGPLTLSASLGFFTCTRTEPLTYTNYVDNAATNQIDTFARPAFASHVYFARFPQGDSWTLDFRRNNGGAPIYSRVIPADVFLDAPIKLPNDTGMVKVIYTGATPVNTSRLMWGLYL
jgi:hypothetical protein